MLTLGNIQIRDVYSCLVVMAAVIVYTVIWISKRDRRSSASQEQVRRQYNTQNKKEKLRQFMNSNRTTATEIKAQSDDILNTIKGISNLLLFLFILIPYFWMERLYNALFVKVPPKSVKGEVVLITGTGHGMGKLLAHRYAKEGATVVGWDVNEELNNKTIQEIKELGYPKTYGYKVDVSNRENVMTAAKRVQEEVGDVTILINNAGIMPHHSFLEHTEKEIRRIMDINVMGNFWTLQAFLPAMKRNNHGHVVSLSSVAGQVGCINLVPYCASKFAVRGIMEGLYEEFRLYPNNQVQFTTICPYMVDTGLCTKYEITYPDILPILKPEYVVDRIFEAQTNNRGTVIIPEAIAFWVKLNTTLCTQKAANYAQDNFRAGLLSDLDTK